MSFSLKSEYKPVVPSKYTDKITSLFQENGVVWCGREDGVVDFRSSHSSGYARVFEGSFDCLESEDVKEKVSAIACVSDGGANKILFAGNEKSMKVLSIRNSSSTQDIWDEKCSDEFRTAEIRHFPNIHPYVLNSLSMSLGSEYLLSSDYVRINLWNPLKIDRFFNLVDIKALLAGGVVFVINSARFSQFNDTLFGYSISNGTININDMSVSPKSGMVMSFKNHSTGSVKSISDFSFVDPHTIVTRSMNNVCVFDMRNQKKELLSKEFITVASELNKLNTSEAIYDKFKIAGSSSYVYTGSYFGSIYCLDWRSGMVEEVRVGKDNQYGFENGIRHVVCDENGFSCVFKGALLQYVKNI